MWGRRLIPWLLAALCLAFAMQDADEGSTSPDGGQHATNGALIYDYVRTGNGGSPQQFAKSYLLHYPAISIGYHPPVFHTIEAVFYSVFGVSPRSARLTVAVFASFCVVLLYYLIRRTHDSDWFATLCVVVFFSLQLSQQAVSDVMLEFPSLFFVLLALHCLLDFQSGFTWRAALSFAVASSVAIWTKQHTVFLGLVPFLLVFTTGRWIELKRFPLWIGAIVFGASCLLLAAFMNQVVGDDYRPTSQVTSAGWAQYVLTRNVSYYAWRLRLFFGWSTVIATVASCIAYLVQRFRRPDAVKRLAIYAAWAASVLPVPLVAWQNDERYLFAGFPAFVVILLDIVMLGAESLGGQRRARWATILVAVLLFGVHVRDYRVHSSGPVEAAQWVWERQPKRILVCGRGGYQFIFTIRCLAGDTPAMIILRGTKLSPDMMKTDQFDQFAHDYGLEYLVIGDDWKAARRQDKVNRKRYAWDPILAQPTPNMALEQKLDMASSYKFMAGNVLVYRLTDPSPHPKNDLDLWMGILNRKLEMDLSEDAAKPDRATP